MKRRKSALWRIYARSCAPWSSAGGWGSECLCWWLAVHRFVAFLDDIRELGERYTANILTVSSSFGRTRFGREVMCLYKQRHCDHSRLAYREAIVTSPRVRVGT